MNSFTDAEGNTWKVKITVPVLKAVRDSVGIDIGKQHDFLELADDIVNLVNVLYVVCRKQCLKREVTEEGFAEALAGDSLEDAYEAFCQAYLDFCPSRQRKILQRILTAAKEIEALAEPEIEARMDRLRESLNFATNAQES